MLFGFLFPVVGLKGQTFWALRSSPIKEKKIILIKFILGFMLVLPIAEFIAAASNIPFVGKTELRLVLLSFGIFSAFWIFFDDGIIGSRVWSFLCKLSRTEPDSCCIYARRYTDLFLATLIYLIIIVVIILVPISAYFAALFKSKIFHFELFLIAEISLL